MRGDDTSASSQPAPRRPGKVDRRALQLSYANAALWAVGNGLTTGPLILYLAQELGAEGTALSLLLAAPALIGLLRLATPALIRPLGGIKAACLKASTASYLLLAAGLPAVTLAVAVPRPRVLGTMIGLICVHQLLEYVGTVALWSWLAALVPQRIRGRYFARRQIWQQAFLIPTMLASGLFTDYWRRAYSAHGPAQMLLGYVIPTSIGTALLLASLVPLALMPDVPAPPPAGRRTSGGLWPTRDTRFSRLLFYRCWLSFFNGLTQAAQNIYMFALPIGLLPMQAMQIGMRAGQIALSPAFGRAIDRFGNRPVLELSQAIVAAGMLFYCFANSSQRWWIVGAYVLFSAYAGLNISLMNLMLKLSPPRENTGYIATFEALSGVAFAVATIGGGILFDRLRTVDFYVAAGPLSLNRFTLLFLCGAVGRAIGVAWVARIEEPGAKRLRDLLRAHSTVE